MRFNVFCDFHHAGLLQSLILLFERRLHGMVMRPIGTDWYTKGFWKVYDHPATVEQFLGIGGATPDNTPRLNDVVQKVDWGGKILQDGSVQNDGETYFCHDIDSDTTNRAITLDSFMHAKIDIVIASLPYHVEPFKRLCELHPNKPKLIFQIGNAWTTEAAQAPNIMASAIITGVPESVNFISYHQEFDLDIFKPPAMGAGRPGKNIYSFVNCFDTAAHFAADWQLFLQMETAMPEWSFRAHGGQCRDGAIGPSPVLADKMREAMFIWHTKAGGDGYGHVIHNAPAVARPLIVKKQYYAGKMAEALLIDGETCIAIDGLDYQQVIHKIEHYSEPNRYAALCAGAYYRFTQVVNFDREQKDIERFLAKLL